MKQPLLLILAIGLCQAAFPQTPKLDLVKLATGLTSPIDITNCGDNRIFIVEQAGYIVIMDKKGNIDPTPFLDIHTEANSSGNEQGLLTVAFGPTFKQDGYFYVNYIYGGGNGNTRISRFQVSPTDSNVAIASTEKILLTFAQPYTNHNGSTLLFGADGYLYDTQGDGGDGGDPDGNGQDTAVYLAKILRLDVSDHDTTYIIPPSNPFYKHGVAKGEIWAYGVRNPWRCSFDRLTHDFWIGDVGQNLYEEVDFQPANSTGGQNYGWRCYEGTFTYNTSGCGNSGFTWPIFEYIHSTPNGCAVIGGNVYRGALYSKLWGSYLCTDNCSGRFWAINQTSPGVFVGDTLQSFLTNAYTTFGEDNEGELYVAERTPGTIYKITDTSNCNPVAFISLQDSFVSCSAVTLTALFNDSLSYQWLNSNGEINGATGNQFTPQTTGWYKVLVSKSQPGCQSTSDSVFVAPYDSTALTVVSQNLSYCLPHDTVALAGNISPTGGVFSGNGITNSNFVPDTNDIGNNPITYQYTNLLNCMSSAVFLVHIDTVSTLTRVVTTDEYCYTNTPISLDGFITPTGGTYSGGGVISDTFNAYLAGIGYDQIIYTYSNISGCISSYTFNLAVSVCTGVATISETPRFDIMPDPNNGTFQLLLSGWNDKEATISIIDELGRLCAQQTLMASSQRTVVPFQLNAVSAGMYFIQVRSGGVSTVQRFIIE